MLISRFLNSPGWMAYSRRVPLVVTEGPVKIGLLVVALFLPLPVHAWDEPDAFRGVPWGASEETLNAKIPSTCFKPGGDFLGDRVCSASFTIGEVPVKALLYLRSDSFVGVSLFFDPRHFSVIEGAFKGRYGPPTRSEEEQGKTRGGLEFVNQVHEWQGTKVYIRLRKYSGKITESNATIQTATETEERIKRFQERKKKGAGDL
jgi:hypothetical protein